MVQPIVMLRLAQGLVLRAQHGIDAWRWPSLCLVTLYTPSSVTHILENTPENHRQIERQLLPSPQSILCIGCVSLASISAHVRSCSRTTHTPCIMDPLGPRPVVLQSEWPSDVRTLGSFCAWNVALVKGNGRRPRQGLIPSSCLFWPIHASSLRSLRRGGLRDTAIKAA